LSGSIKIERRRRNKPGREAVREKEMRFFESHILEVLPFEKGSLGKYFWAARRKAKKAEKKAI